MVRQTSVGLIDYRVKEVYIVPEGAMGTTASIAPSDKTSSANPL